MRKPKQWTQKRWAVITSHGWLTDSFRQPATFCTRKDAMRYVASSDVRDVVRVTVTVTPQGLR